MTFLISRLALVGEWNRSVQIKSAATRTSVQIVFKRPQVSPQARYQLSSYT